MENHKLDIRLPNGAAFTAEGTQEMVRDLFAQFLEALKASPIPIQTQPQAPSSPVTVPNTPTANGNGTQTPAEGGGGLAQLDRTTLERLFRVDGENVSLTALPRGEDRDGEALVAILYGFSALRNQSAVTADRLMKSARQSGVQNVRANRVLARQQSYVTESGTGKARRYGLNNPGLRRAEEILRGILG